MGPVTLWCSCFLYFSEESNLTVRLLMSVYTHTLHETYITFVECFVSNSGAQDSLFYNNTSLLLDRPDYCIILNRR